MINTQISKTRIFTGGLFMTALFYMNLFATPVIANEEADENSAAKGLAVAEETKRRDTGYGDFSTVATMTLRNAQGQSSVRKMTVQTLEEPSVGEKSLIVFLEPADTRDTALLSYSYKEEADDQ